MKRGGEHSCNPSFVKAYTENLNTSTTTVRLCMILLFVMRTYQKYVNPSPALNIDIFQFAKFTLV